MKTACVKERYVFWKTTWHEQKKLSYIHYQKFNHIFYVTDILWTGVESIYC